MRKRLDRVVDATIDGNDIVGPVRESACVFEFEECCGDALLDSHVGRIVLEENHVGNLLPVNPIKIWCDYNIRLEKLRGHSLRFSRHRG